MSRTEVLVELFEHYGDDADAALAAMANVANEEWSRFVDQAAARQYRAEYRLWVRRQTVEASTEQSNPRLFDVEDLRDLRLRDRIVVHRNGERQEHRLLGLAGEHGADIILAACKRDERGARTTLTRTSAMKKLAKEMVRRSKVEGRPVSVTEILEGRAA